MDDLLVLFHEAETPREGWLVGTEAERIAVRQADGAHLPYDGPVIALRRDDASVTLEPGSQIELSGAPYRSVYDGKSESDAHWADLQPVIEELGLVWLALGLSLIHI